MKNKILLIAIFIITCNSKTKNELINSSGKKIFQRMDFKSVLLGKPEYFVREFLGEPDDNPSPDLYHLDEAAYIYYNRTYLNEPEDLDKNVIIYLRQEHTRMHEPEGKWTVANIIFN